MARVNRPNETVPDGWFFVEPETGHRIDGETLAHLVDLVCQHRAWKSIKPDDAPTVRVEVERQICAVQYPGICSGEAGEDYVPLVDLARGITIDSLMSATQSAFNFIKSGFELVPKEESQRRAGICRGCRLNRGSPCTVCSAAFSLMNAMIPKERIEPGLSACGICGCSNAVKCLLPLETILSQDAEKRYIFPSYCWLTPDGKAQETDQGSIPA